METAYVACDLGAHRGRVLLGNLHQGKLRLSEIHRFDNAPIQVGDDSQWDIAGLYHQVMQGLAEVGRADEPIHSISCSSWGHDYMLFDSGGSLITPTHAQPTPRAQAGMRDLLSRIPSETIYEETGGQPQPHSTLFQLGVEKPRRLARGNRLLPVADGFNFLLSGQAGIEGSMAGTTQLFNPFQQVWSDRLVSALRLPPHLLPPVVPSGTLLGPLRDSIAEQIRLEDVNVVSSCSHALASAIAGLPAHPDVPWAFLQPGTWAQMGVELPHPLASPLARQLGFANETGYGGTVRFMKPTVGLWLVEECRRAWAGTEYDLDPSVIMHLAAQAPPFESLINPLDERILSPGDVPQKIKAFCKETGQPVPRKPGPIIRCVLESIALSYRRTLEEIQRVTGQRIQRLFVLDGGFQNPLLTSFITNALQIPIVIVPEESTAVGNVLLQAIALGHLSSLEVARQIVSDSFRFETLHPHATVWNSAYERLEQFT
ncbi:MAG: rhamnulokinase [Verrucomicrobiae bacterium]|nr:rhamnulokinase [Verrucomicrobiae bacterium]